MNACPTCQHDADPDAVRCPQCGRSLRAGIDEPLERVGTIEDAIQAGVLKRVLEEQGVPCVLRSYHDTAYDGLFQAQSGWGALLVPRSQAARARAIFDDVHELASRASDDDAGSDDD